MQSPGELAIVLHTHMPYVEGGGPWPPAENAPILRSPEGFGTWPFGEEWLWEAVATSYVPLLGVLGRAPITLSLTPVLCDQLEAPRAVERCLTFLREIRPESHRLDVEAYRTAGEHALADELERSAADYAAAADALESLGPGGLLAALGEHVAWTSSATHAVLPLLATDAGLELQLQAGIASHRRRFGAWAGGFWLPECADAGWLHGALEDAGVRATCVELTGLLGAGSERHLRPLATDDGPVLWPIDRAVVDLVWGRGGYPSDPVYRNHTRLTPHDHRVWSYGGGPYDRAAAEAAVRRHAEDFVERVRSRVAGGGVCVCALDTELLGHWWYEGVAWLGAVIEEAERRRLPIVSLDDAVERHEPATAPELDELRLTSWGEGGDLRTWSGPDVADLAFAARRSELEAVAALAGRRADGTPAVAGAARQRALRELLALQSSDWAFLAARGTAGDYPRERAAAHAAALAAALAQSGGEPVDAGLRNLAPDL